MSEKYAPRLYADLTSEQMKRIQDLIPWGLRSKLMLIIVEDLLDLIEKLGPQAIALIIARRMKPRDVMFKELQDAIKESEAKHNRDASGRSGGVDEGHSTESKDTEEGSR